MEDSAFADNDEVDALFLSDSSNQTPEPRLAADTQNDVPTTHTDDNDDWRKEFDQLHVTENKLWKRDRLVRQQEKRCLSNYLRSINYDVAFVRKFCAQQA